METPLAMLKSQQSASNGISTVKMSTALNSHFRGLLRTKNVANETGKI